MTDSTPKTAPTSARQHIDAATASRGAVYNLMNSIVAPRAIAWVSTRSARGINNLAPHSYCMIVSADPPIIAFSSAGAKDTLANIKATGEFVFNHVPGVLAAQMNLSSADFPPETSEFDWTGLTPLPSVVVAAPSVGESPAAMECRVRDIQEFGNGPSAYLIIADVVYITVDAALYADGILDDKLSQPVGRLARSGYVRSTTFFDLPRPTYQGLLDEGAKPQRNPAVSS